jgi:hypothetical protein
MERRDKRGRVIGYNWWREWIVDQWFYADHAWSLTRESVALGYETEEQLYNEEHPRPTLKSFMVGLAGSTRQV